MTLDYVDASPSSSAPEAQHNPSLEREHSLNLKLSEKVQQSLDPKTEISSRLQARSEALSIVTDKYAISSQLTSDLPSNSLKPPISTSKKDFNFLKNSYPDLHDLVLKGKIHPLTAYAIAQLYEAKMLHLSPEQIFQLADSLPPPGSSESFQTYKQTILSTQIQAPTFMEKTQILSARRLVLDMLETADLLRTKYLLDDSGRTIQTIHIQPLMKAASDALELAVLAKNEEGIEKIEELDKTVLEEKPAANIHNDITKATSSDTAKEIVALAQIAVLTPTDALKQIGSKKKNLSRRKFLAIAGLGTVGIALAGTQIVSPGKISRVIQAFKDKLLSSQAKPVHMEKTQNQPEKLTKEQLRQINIARAEHLYQSIKNNFFLPNGLPCELYQMYEGPQGSGSGLWPFVNIMSAANILRMIPEVGQKYQSDIEDMYEKITAFYKLKNPHLKTTLLTTGANNTDQIQGANVSLDDPAEFQIEVLRFHMEMLRLHNYQDSSTREKIISSISDNWDEILTHWKVNYSNPGGLPFMYYGNIGRTMAANTTWIMVGARMYMLTGDEKYLGGKNGVLGAIDMYSWLRSNLSDTQTLSDPDKLLMYDNMAEKGNIGKYHYPYNEGYMLGAALELAKAMDIQNSFTATYGINNTSSDELRRNYLLDAKKLVHGSLDYYSRSKTNLLKSPEGPKLVVGLLEYLYSYYPIATNDEKKQILAMADTYRTEVWEGQGQYTRYPPFDFVHCSGEYTRWDNVRSIRTVTQGAWAKILALGGLKENQYADLL